MTRELAVISGKGGTGKTSVAASLAVLAERSVVADCDVDAADMHLLLPPRTTETHEFRSGHEAVIGRDECSGCGVCQELCRYDAIERIPERSGMAPYRVDPAACEGCGVCVRFCPASAIDFPERTCGSWMISETRCGPMVHARLGVAAENSGKLVSTVRREARRIAEENDFPLVVVDGPPGIGCPVIASVTGASLVLVVTEPTVSGEHDLRRVLGLTRHFKIPATICVNKWDLNAEMTARIERGASLSGASVVGRIRYDPTVTRAQMRQLSIVETEGPAAEDVRQMYEQLGLYEKTQGDCGAGTRGNRAKP